MDYRVADEAHLPMLQLAKDLLNAARRASEVEYYGLNRDVRFNHVNYRVDGAAVFRCGEFSYEFYHQKSGSVFQMMWWDDIHYNGNRPYHYEVCISFDELRNLIAEAEAYVEEEKKAERYKDCGAGI